MKKRILSKQRKAYIIFTVSLALFCFVFLAYVGIVVLEYDNHQPEKCVEAEIEKVKRYLSENGSLEGYINIAAANSKYSGISDEEFCKQYDAKLKSAEIGYKLNAGSNEGLEKNYSLTADGEAFADLSLKGENSKTKLFFFTMAQWNITSLSPLPLGDAKNLTVCLPDGIACTINGFPLNETPTETANGIKKYKVSNVRTNDSIVFKRDDGSNINYTLKDNVVTPVVYNYSFSLSPDITVTVDGAASTGIDDGNGSLRYNIQKMTKPDVIFTDAFGNSCEYNGTDMQLSGFTVTVPDNFVVTVGEKTLSADSAVRAENPDSAELNAYISGIKLCDILTYRISALKDKIKIKITDNLGSSTEHELKSGFAFSQTYPNGDDSIPAEINSQIDPMKFAVDWSKFMTNDLSFNQIAKYFAKDSKYYKEAYGWAHGVDRIFTSAHKAPVFSGEKLQNYVGYSDDCFSVRVSLSKSMYLTKVKRTVVDNLDMIVYFVKSDSGWVVAVKHDA